MTTVIALSMAVALVALVRGLLAWHRRPFTQAEIDE